MTSNVKYWILRPRPTGFDSEPGHYAPVMSRSN
jgi:hypothetical protein